jgi:hypothetical protein
VKNKETFVSFFPDLHFLLCAELTHFPFEAQNRSHPHKGDKQRAPARYNFISFRSGNVFAMKSRGFVNHTQKIPNRKLTFMGLLNFYSPCNIFALFYHLLSESELKNPQYMVKGL